MASTKRTTAADLAAAVKLGTIDPSTEVVTAAEASKRERKAVNAATKAVMATATAATAAVASAGLSATQHDCGIPGCRHGDSHPTASQPDRQVKLQCPVCGAVARMTASALAKGQGLGITCTADQVQFAPAARRTYSKRA